MNKKKILILSFLLYLCGIFFCTEVKAATKKISVGKEYNFIMSDDERDLDIDYTVSEKSKVKVCIYDIYTTHLEYREEPMGELPDITHLVEYYPTDATLNSLDISFGEDDKQYHIGKNQTYFEKTVYVGKGVNFITIFNDCRANTTTRFKVKIIAEKCKNATCIKMSKKLTVTKGFKKKISYKLVNKKSEILSGLKWKSSNKRIATVDKKGNVKGKKKGKCKIYCILQNGKSYICNVSVKDNIYKGRSLSRYYVDDYKYGEVKLEVSKAYYKGKTLFVECVALNNRIFNADKFQYIDVDIENSKGTLVARKRFKNYSLNIGAKEKKVITFKFPNRKKKYDLRTEVIINYYYIYQYSY